jgi:hypothetical protein
MAAIVGVLGLVVAAVSVLEFAYQPPPSPYRSAVLASRPAGYWNLGEFHGPHLRDAVEGTRSGRYRGAIGFGTHGAIPSSTDTAVQLDVRGGRIILGAPVPAAQPFSLAFWVRPDSESALGALYSSFRPPPEGPRALLPWIVASQTTRASTWTVTFEISGYLSLTYRRREWDHATRVSARVEAGVFSFVATTFGRHGAQVWINGRRPPVRVQRIGPFAIGRPAPLTLGGTTGVGMRPFAGTIDDVAVYSRPLRDSEVRRLWRIAH